jgi:hypothetical protein
MRKAFLASCWVIVLPPCEPPRSVTLLDEGAQDAARIDAQWP